MQLWKQTSNGNFPSENAQIWRKGGGLFPSYQTMGSVGADLTAAEDYSFAPGQVQLVKTGVVLKPPTGTFAMLVARSSLFKRGLMLANGVGIIDPDYSGGEDEILAALMNIKDHEVEVQKGERIVQLVFLPYIKPMLVPMDEVGESRGGFGSTG